MVLRRQVERQDSPNQGLQRRMLRRKQVQPGPIRKQQEAQSMAGIKLETWSLINLCYLVVAFGFACRTRYTETAFLRLISKIAAKSGIDLAMRCGLEASINGVISHVSARIR